MMPTTQRLKILVAVVVVRYDVIDLVSWIAAHNAQAVACLAFITVTPQHTDTPD
uniref:Uncharacterized protein n=1 Tax=Arthrobacter phage SWEP2 TaxID=2945958 RepID=A0A9E7MI60_9CAUD